MRIRHLMAVGYVPLKLLRGITHFEMSFSSIYQAIIGTNGSGKSSVLRLLSGLPPHHTEFKSGGKYVLTFDHRGIVYQTSCDFTNKPKYSFVRFITDGQFEELNPGHTLTVQYELCERIIGMTPALFDILIGEVKFENMSATVRRDWLMKLSGGDMDYAMGVFKRLKTHHRDLTGGLKLVNQRIAIESGNVISDEEVEAAKKQCQYLKDLLSFLMEQKQPNLPDLPKIEKQRKDAIDRFRKIGEQVGAIGACKPNYLNGCDNIDAVSDFISNLNFQKEFLGKSLESIAKEIEKVQNFLDSLASSNASDLQGLIDHVTSLKTQRDAIVGMLTLVPYEAKGYDYEAAISAFYGVLVECYNSMPENPNQMYSSELLNIAETDMHVVRMEHERWTSDINRLNAEIEALKKSPKSECPQCHHVWSPGHHDLHIKEKNRELEIAISRFENTSAHIQELSAYIEKARTYRHYRIQINRVISGNPKFSLLWKHISDIESSTCSHVAIEQVINTCLQQSAMLSKAYKLDQEIERYENAIAHSQDMSQSQGNFQDQRLLELESSWETTHSKLKEIETIHREATKFLQVAKQMSFALIELDQAKAEIDELTETQINCIRNSVINQGIRENQSALAHCENDLNQALSVKGILDDLKRQKVDLEKQIEVSKLMLDELNPTDGLIAEEMNSFIHSFVEELNDRIKEIWEHDLKVLPCGINSGELDYRFPLSVNGNAPVSPDFSVKTSLGQRDMVNLAFRLSFYVFLDMFDYPLWLDELAPSFDEQHRFNIMNFVKAHVDSNRCSQMFMVSHYVSAHGMFTNAEICIMDDSNLINKPDVFNQHVIAR